MPFEAKGDSAGQNKNRRERYSVSLNERLQSGLKKKKMIEKAGVNSRILVQDPSTVGQSWWPELEERLYGDFMEARKTGRVVRRGWFREQAGFLF